MKKKPYNSSMKTSTLTRSRTYIVVPRDVPPENFISVTETRKVRKVGLLRCCLPPLAVCIAVACLLAGIGYLVYRYNSNVTADWPGNLKSLPGKKSAMEICEITEFGCCPDNKTIRLDKGLESCLTICVHGDCAARNLTECTPGSWGRGEIGCEPCLCSGVGSLGLDCNKTTGQCNCRTGYAGHKCNICPDGTVQRYGGCEETQAQDPGTPCTSQPCQGGGTCEEHDGTFSCYCTLHRSGKYCEKIHPLTDLEVAGFIGTSFVQLKPMSRSVTRTSVELSFRSFSYTGLILHTAASSNQFISIRLVNGVVEFEYSMGEAGSLTLVSSIPIQLGEWHTIKARRYHQDGILLFDEHEPVIGQAPGSEKNLKLTNSTFIGAKPGGQYPGFQGCIKDVELDHNPVSLVSGKEPQLISALALTECTKHPCSTLPCKHAGECLADSSSYQCNCQPGFFGTRCGKAKPLCIPNPCENDGSCSVVNEKVVCGCKDGFSGGRCQINLGYLNTRDTGYLDTRDTGYLDTKDSGYLDTRNTVYLDTRETNPEEDMQADQGDQEDVEGMKVDTLHLQGNSVYWVNNRVHKRMERMKTNDISLRFRTSLESGTIFYSGGVTDSLELGVVAGRLVIRAHIGSPAGLGRGVAVSKERVDTGSWQNALVRRNGRRLYVRLNEKEVLAAEVEGEDTDQYLNTDGKLWIGGRAPSPNLNQNYFTGDLKDVQVEGVQVLPRHIQTVQEY